MKYTVYFLLLAVFLLGSSGGLMGCGSCKGGTTNEGYAMGEYPDQYPDSIQWDFKDKCIENGVKQWEVQALKASMYISNIQGKEVRTVYLSNVTLILFRSNERRAELTADSAVFNDIEKTVHAEGNIVVITEDGTKIYTDTLSMDRVGGNLVTDDPVRIVRPDGSWIRGIGLESDYEAEKYTIFHVTGRSTSGL